MKSTTSYQGPGDRDGPHWEDVLQGGTSPLWMPDIREIISENTSSLQWVLLTGHKEWLGWYFLIELRKEWLRYRQKQMMKIKTCVSGNKNILPYAHFVYF